MKLKLIVAALGLVASAASQATIVPTTTVGGSDVLLEVWEQGASTGAPDQSFAFDLGITLTQFVNNSNNSSTLATLLSTDTTWTNFLNSSSPVLGDLQWSVVASGSNVPVTASMLASVTVGEDVTDPFNSGTGMTNGTVLGANGQLGPSIATLNQAANPNEQIVTNTGSKAYFQYSSLGNFNGYAWDNGNNIGVTGVEIAQSSNVGGLQNVAARTTILPGTLGFVQSGSNYVLSYTAPVSAVPEAPGSVLMLAGAGALALLAFRRKNA
jgi:hypothetical protein